MRESIAMATSNIGTQTVSVTGARGFIGSWNVKYLLLKGYTVRGTVRDIDEKKNSHLNLLDGAEEKLTLCKADVQDYTSLCTAFRGCQGVFHTASPVSNDPDLVATAVEGTKNVINAAAEVGIHRVVFTSSFGAVHLNPGRSSDMVVDESCWSDLEFCKNTNNWYSYAKMVAELSAIEESVKRGVNLISIVPHLTVGPMLQSVLNASVYRVLTYLRGTKKEYPNAVMGVVDVRDVARAHVLLYENTAASGRYLCIERIIHRSEFVAMLSDMFPEYPITSKCQDTVNPMVKPYKFSNQRLKDLGFQFTPFRESLYETVKSLQDKGHLIPTKDVLPPKHRSLL